VDDTVSMTVSGVGYVGQTAWGQRFARRVRRLTGSEAGGAVVLLVAAVAALVWANVDGAAYNGIWSTPLAVSVGSPPHGVALELSLREWVNSGLMSFFFLVVGLEARREFDLGELRERRRLVLPLLAGMAGMVLPVAIYLSVTAGTRATVGWGAAMSTDTALALGLLALAGIRSPALRSFLLTVLVVDDLVALTIIAVVYTGVVAIVPLLVAAGVLVLVVVARAAHVRSGFVYAVLGVAAWVALHESGVDPVTAGLTLGLLTWARPASREKLEVATDLVRAFREQPTAALARTARVGLGAAISPNAGYQQLYSPWVTFLVVPLFALANVGIPVGGDALAAALASPITLGIVAAYVLGKPVGIAGMSWLVTVVTRGRLRPPVGWAAVVGGGTIAGVGFTVSLLIATLAFTGPDLDAAKLGVLAAAVVAFALSKLVFTVTAMLPESVGERALLGSSPVIVDLLDPIDEERDHLRGPSEAPVSMVEYGDFECPYCGQAEPVVRELLAERGDVRYVWRHLPLTDVHPRAQVAAEAAEAAAEQGRFWEMHDLLLDHPGQLQPRDLVAYAKDLGLDVERFRDDLHSHLGRERIAADVASADRSAVSGTPTFFVNGRRHHGAYDIGSLTAEVNAARVRAEAGR
jgi:Na+/H+ antiporter NhaA